MRRKNHKISYIRKPFARKSFFCLPLAAAALVFGIVSLVLSVRMQGNGEINVAAWGLSSILFAVAALAYGMTSFLEREMNYILSKIGIGISAALLVFWVCMIIVGLFI